MKLKEQRRKVLYNQILKNILPIKTIKSLKVSTFQKQENISDYTEWCVCKQESFDNYTRDGLNALYFCLINGFQAVKREPNVLFQWMNIGLSMIAITVNRSGDLLTCTSRWNCKLTSWY